MARNRQHVDNWYDKYQEILTSLGIKDVRAYLWNVDETECLKHPQTEQSCRSSSELSMSWVDPQGWVGLVENFYFSGLGWVMGLKWQICEKQMPCK